MGDFEGGGGEFDTVDKIFFTLCLKWVPRVGLKMFQNSGSFFFSLECRGYTGAQHILPPKIKRDKRCISKKRVVNYLDKLSDIR